MAIKSILVIEDDRFIGEMYVRSLQRAGYDVDWMVDGSDGAVAARNKPYDLIMLDIMLPEKRGSEILAELRGDNKDLIPHTRVIVLTNFEQDDESRLAMEHNVDAYLIKAEITPRKLLETIQELDKLPPLGSEQQ
ncbi:MAG TPA: response regulator [Patescibacteria group bacterium]|jgi:DNA-binding response OmpR family regulator|nr:response regulator [Patescibacteria group bacterium]